MTPPPTLADLKAVAAQFRIPGRFLEGSVYGNGHINATFAATFRRGAARERYVLQCINAHIFREPLRLMENVARVTRHIRRKLEAAGVRDTTRRVLTLVETRAGAMCLVDPEGRVWRCYLFVEGASSLDIIQTPAQAHAAARAFGAFQRLLMDYDGPRLFETIPHFHDTCARVEALKQALAEDRCGRAAAVAPELRQLLDREALAGSLLSLQAAGGIPERITHNDTKLNNILLDDRTGEGICVLDLDTVMPGLSLYDFGDMVRTGTNPVAEDAPDPTLQVRLPMFQALARGYLEGVGGTLLPAERERLVLAGQLLTFETAVRFLTDHLEGDHYFRIQRPDHNLDRCRNQLALLGSLEAHAERMNAFVAELGEPEPVG